MADESSYTDRDLMVVTQIAYYDFAAEQLEAHGGSAAVRQLLNESNTYQKLQNNVNKAETELEKLMAQRGLELYEDIVAEGSRYGDWKVVDVKDENEATGFYGVLLEIDPEHAAVGFRGSESTDMNQVIKDWMNADLGLLMDKDTLQQTLAAEYMAEIDQNFHYSQYAATGHSLGGNLAEHAVIMAPDGMRAKIAKTVNFDGPGFSKEYIDRHQPETAKVPDPVVHYRWSLVGALLTHPACTATRVIQVTDEIRPLEDLDSNYMRHSTAFLAFSGEWVQDGAADLLSIGMGSWSKKVDAEVIKKRREKQQKE